MGSWARAAARWLGLEVSQQGASLQVMDDMRAWARLGHQLAGRAAAVLGDASASLVLEVPGDPCRYVQWHGESGREFYAEAASGEYDDTHRTPSEIATLTSLGWAAPGQGWGAEKVRNWSLHWAAPVDLYAVVRLTVRTLREVFHADPHDLMELL